MLFIRKVRTMELWIRSQDKMKLLKCESLVIDNTCPEMESVGEYCICDSFERHIAKYKSKERALEVLDEIQNYICPNGSINLYDGTRVYEMPKE